MKIFYFGTRCNQVYSICRYLSDILYRFHVVGVLSQTSPKRKRELTKTRNLICDVTKYHDKSQEFVNLGIFSNLQLKVASVYRTLSPPFSS